MQRHLEYKETEKREDCIRRKKTFKKIVRGKYKRKHCKNYLKMHF